MSRAYFLRQWFNLSDPDVEEALHDSAAPRSTKNHDGERDPEMPQMAKGQQWYFGMKAHVAVDSRSKLFRTVLASAANVADRDVLPYQRYGRETRVRGDQGYQGQTEVIRRCSPAARNCTNRRYRQGGWIDESIKARNSAKARVRGKVEHSIGVVKCVFGFQKVRYRGLAKNLHRLRVTATLANLFMLRRQLLACRGSVGGGRQMTPNRSNVAAQTLPRSLIGPSFAVVGKFDALDTGSSDLP